MDQTISVKVSKKTLKYLREFKHALGISHRFLIDQLIEQRWQAWQASGRRQTTASKTMRG